MSVPAFVMPTGPMRPKRMRSRVDMLSFDDVWIGPTSNTLFSNEVDRIPPAASEINFDFCVDGSAFLPIFAALATCAAFLQSRFVTTKAKTPKRDDNDGEMVESSITDELPAFFPSTISLSDDKPRDVAPNALVAGIQTDKLQRRSFDAQLLLPGGGVFLFWQIGVLSVLKQQFDLSRVVMTGASAGAIAATLTAAGVDHDEFVRLCLQTCDDMKLWTRRLGLIGKMGSLMERVLHQLLPQDTADRLRDHNISMILTPFGSTEVVRIHNFRTKQCVMDAVMASAHIPLLLNKRLMAHFDGQAYIDGSFFAKHQDFVRNDIRAPIIALDHMDDPSMQDKTLLDCIRITSKADAWDMYQSGRSHAKAMMERGDLGCLTKRAALTQPSRQRMRI